MSDSLPADSLSLLVKQAREAMGNERRARADRFNRACAQLPPSRENADALLALVEGDSLEGLADADGLSCRDAAFRSLVGMGYPYALEIVPEALTQLRRQRPAGSLFGWGTRQWVLTGLGLSGSLAVAFLRHC